MLVNPGFFLEPNGYGFPWQLRLLVLGACIGSNLPGFMRYMISSGSAMQLFTKIKNFREARHETLDRIQINSVLKLLG